MARPYFQNEKQEHELQQVVRMELARQLRARYEAAIADPLPDRLAALLERLDDRSR